MERFKNNYETPRLSACEVRPYNVLCGSVGYIIDMTIADPLNGDDLFE